MRQIVVSLIIMSLVSSCMVGPNYHKRQCCCHDQWDGYDEDGVVANTEAVDLEWWKSFNDPVLDALIAEALTRNYDLAQATVRVAEARALRSLACSKRAPKFTPIFAADRVHLSRNQSFGGIIPSTVQLTFNEWLTGAEVEWETDLWGKLRRQAEAANAEYCSSIWGRRAITMVLLGEVANTYMELRGSQKRIALAFKNLNIQTAGVEVTEARFSAGLISELDVSQARTIRSTTEAEIPRLKRDVQELIARMGVLLGYCPNTLLKPLIEKKPIPVRPPEISLGTDCGIVCRRPDVQALERQLAAATANIGVAVADYFPQLTLLQLLNFESIELRDFLSPGSLAWFIGATFLGPVVQGSRLRAQVEVEVARKWEAYYAYQQSILTAYSEVRNALISYKHEKERFLYLENALEAAERSFDLSNTLYQNGLINFLDVLVAESQVNDLDDELAISETLIVTYAVNLYKALGGGWEAADCCTPNNCNFLSELEQASSALPPSELLHG